MALYRRGRLYSVEIQRETELSLRHLNNVLPEMVKDDFVVFDIEKNKKYYRLTTKGAALAYALTNPDGLAALYNIEETAKLKRRVETPKLKSLKSLINFRIL